MIINIKFSENVSKKRLEVSTVKLLCSSRHISRSRGVCYSVTQQEKAFPLSLLLLPTTTVAVTAALLLVDNLAFAESLSGGGGGFGGGGSGGGG